MDVAINHYIPVQYKLKKENPLEHSKPAQSSVLTETKEELQNLSALP